MNRSFRNFLVLITTVVYLVFACTYVVFCKRDLHKINLIEFFTTASSKLNSEVIPVVKNESWAKVYFKFSVRPRLINNHISPPDFFIISTFFILLLTCANPMTRAFRLHYKSLFNPRSHILVLHTWRI